MKQRPVLVGERKRKESKHPIYHRYLDFRAIIPAIVIAFVFTAFCIFYILDAVIVPIFIDVATSISGITVSITDPLLSTASNIALFTLEFIVVFLIVYFILLVFFREQDKKLYMEYKRKRLI